MSLLHVAATAGQDRARFTETKKATAGSRRSPADHLISRCHPVIVPLPFGAVTRSGRGGAPSPFPRTRCAPWAQDRACCGSHHHLDAAPVSGVSAEDLARLVLVEGADAGPFLAGCLLRFKRGGRTLAVATIFRDGESLAAELAMERDV